VRPATDGFLWLVVPLGLIASCGGGDGDGKNPTSSTSADQQYLVQHNARFNDGRTVRWANLPIRVFANDIAREDEVTEWARASGGAVTFTFVGSAAGANITFRFGQGDDICGSTEIRYLSSGEILSADVQVIREVFRGPQCTRTVVHEVGHAIGYLDHSDDGGLMDADGGNGALTPPVAGMIRLLYSMAPGTFVAALTPRAAERPRGGQRSIRIVDPVRR
jgi:hypothetical protein